MVCDRSSFAIGFGTHYSVNASFVDAIALNTIFILQFVSNGRFSSFMCR